MPPANFQIDAEVKRINNENEQSNQQSFKYKKYIFFKCNCRCKYCMLNILSTYKIVHLYQVCEKIASPKENF